MRRCTVLCAVLAFAMPACGIEVAGMNFECPPRCENPREAPAIPEAVGLECDPPGFDGQAVLEAVEDHRSPSVELALGRLRDEYPSFPIGTLDIALDAPEMVWLELLEGRDRVAVFGVRRNEDNTYALDTYASCGAVLRPYAP